MNEEKQKEARIAAILAKKEIKDWTKLLKQVEKRVLKFFKDYKCDIELKNVRQVA